MKSRLRRLWSHPAFVPAYLLVHLALGVLLVAVEHPWVHLTDEDDYMPLGLADLVHGSNPYATGRAADHSIDPTCTRHEEPRCWYSLPYFPLSLVLQIPFLDYRWTAMAAFALLGWAVRDRPVPFVALANPGSLVLAANGFTDLVVVALLAWSFRAGRGWLGWLAAGAKQFALPMILVDHVGRREWRKAAEAVGATAVVLLPFVLWDPGAFYYWTFQVHVSGSDHKWSGLLGVGHANYLLYYAFAATVLYPRVRRRGATAARLAAPTRTEG